MSKLSAVLAAMLIFAAFCAAQDSEKKSEVYVGYAYAKTDFSVPGSQNVNGFDTAYTIYPSKYVGLTVDGGATWDHRSDLSQYSVMAGPRVRIPGVVSPFAQVLVGYSNTELRVNNTLQSGDGGSVAIGGGVDIRLTPAISFRPAQVDYMSLKFTPGKHLSWVRYTGGFVLRF